MSERFHIAKVLVDKLNTPKISICFLFSESFNEPEYCYYSFTEKVVWAYLHFQKISITLTTIKNIYFFRIIETEKRTRITELESSELSTTFLSVLLTSNNEIARNFAKLQLNG